MKRRVLFAGLYHETHTFVPGRTAWSDFVHRAGPDLLDAAGDTSPLGGALDAARALGWEPIPALDLRATPSGVVDDDVLERWWDAFARACATPVDAVFLVLHGAMVCQTVPDVEGEILARLRGLPGYGNVPVGGVTDLHANVGERMARHADVLVTYRENPHTDARAAAVRAVHALERVLADGRRPTTLLRPIPVVLAPTLTATADDPMATLERRARALEADFPDVLAANVHAGFAFADTPDTGVSLSVAAFAPDDALVAAVDALAADARRLCRAASPAETALEDALDRLPPHPERPSLLVEPSDNIGGGAPGDATWILHALARRGIEGAVALCDPAAVAALADVPIGSTAQVPLGGWSGPLAGAPFTLPVTLVSRSDGRFALEDPQSHLASMTGTHVAMGPCVTVRHHGIAILVTSLPCPPFDLGQLRSQGIVPEAQSVIAVKAAVAHRRAYDPIAGLSITVTTPGPCTSDLTLLPYRHLRRPIHPLDALPDDL